MRNLLVGSSLAMQALRQQIERAASTSIAVLIRGETGTGKELVAQAIHDGSGRTGPYIAINCAAVPENLLESDLFGHERGAFTGATARRIGKFELTTHGTILLDEIGDLSPAAQVKLLRVLQENQIQRVGGNNIIRIETRVLAATHRDLEKMIREGRFRDDLFFRTGLTIRVPPLRDRLEGLPELVSHFIELLGPEAKSASYRAVPLSEMREPPASDGDFAPSIQPEALDLLSTQFWPGNVRQLKNVIYCALLVSRGLPITRSQAEEAYENSKPLSPEQDQTIRAYIARMIALARRDEVPRLWSRIIEEVERELFTQAIQATHGNQSSAAHVLGVTRKTMRLKLDHFGLHTPPPTDPEDRPAPLPLGPLPFPSAVPAQWAA
ncbi:MAG: hypothetical protein C5B50_16915 [Verrucomicrobia bacterium]|nr:MAG: hypothetical protein C5B50_16915 [Verrucomicrobiota bacterium]